MIKFISVIIVALVIVGGAYWLSGMTKARPQSPAPVTNNSSTNTDTAPSNLTLKGPVGVLSDAKGTHLTDKTGLTLYTNIKDEAPSGKIVPHCDTACEKTWIPFVLGPEEAAPTKSSDPLLSKLNLFKRADGKVQFAIGTTLLYRYAGDTQPGDMKGVSGDWIVAKP